MNADLFQTVMVPIADPDDAQETARAIRAYLGSDSEIIVTHVVPKGEGVPDKASVAQREEFAKDAYEKFLNVLAADVDRITPLTLYGRDAANTIIEGAREANATAIVFTPRGAGRWVKLITGSVSEALIRNSTIPVLVLPPREQNEPLE
jgi:nucleotide-binding universal stress UspA family protein